MKNRDYLRWQPAFHWTDQKLEVHSFYCILALLLATLARKMACEAGVELSLHAILYTNYFKIWISDASKLPSVRRSQSGLYCINTTHFAIVEPKGAFTLAEIQILK